MGKNEITWEVSGRILGGSVIPLQNLQQKRRGINPPFLLFTGVAYLTVQRILETFRRRELDRCARRDGAGTAGLRITPDPLGTRYGGERPESGEENPIAFRKGFRERVDHGLDELFHLLFRCSAFLPEPPYEIILVHDILHLFLMRLARVTA